MRIEMTCDWRDDIPPPHPDTSLSDYVEYKGSPEREAAFDLLLQKEIQEKIVKSLSITLVFGYTILPSQFPNPTGNGEKF
jgi:hypothetical protein